MDAQNDLHFCCLHATKSGFQVTRPIRPVSLLEIIFRIMMTTGSYQKDRKLYKDLWVVASIVNLFLVQE